MNKGEVKTAGYWPSFFCVYRDWGEVEVLKTLLPPQKRIYSIAKIFCFNKSQEWLVYFWALGEEANCDSHNNSSRVHDKVATRTITVAKCTKLAQSYPVYAYLSWLTCPAFVWFSLIWPNTQRKTEAMYSHRQSMVKFEISGYSSKVYM